MVIIAVLPTAVILVIPLSAAMIPHFGEQRRILRLYGRLLRLDGQGRCLGAQSHQAKAHRSQNQKAVFHHV
jgi:hypothetical protein